MPDVITDAAQVTVEWLNDILRRDGYLSDGEVTSVRDVGSETLPNSVVHHLEVGYRGYARLPRRLFLKLSQGPGAGNDGQEVAFYQQVTPPMLLALRPDELPFVRHFDAAYSAETGHAHVLLEDLSLTHTTADRALPPSIPHCEGMVDALASLHAFWWENPRLGRGIGTRPTAIGIDELLAAAPRNLGGWLGLMGDRVAPARRATYERVCTSWPARRVERLVAGRGITLVNRDTHAANFLYPINLERDRVRVIDWQSWRVDTGTDDLAYMIAAHWYAERRARLEKLLVGRYHRRLEECGITGYSWDDCWYDYKASVIRVLFLLIGGWHPGRQPSLWFDRVEKATLAYEELGCALLLP